MCLLKNVKLLSTILVYLFSFGILVAYCVDLSSIYFRYETVTDVRIESPSGKLVLPAITICRDLYTSLDSSRLTPKYRNWSEEITSKEVDFTASSEKRFWRSLLQLFEFPNFSIFSTNPLLVDINHPQIVVYIRNQFDFWLHQIWSVWRILANYTKTIFLLRTKAFILATIYHKSQYLLNNPNGNTYLAFNTNSFIVIQIMNYPRRIFYSEPTFH